MSDLDFDVIRRTLPYLMQGLQYTVQLTLVAAIGGTVFGTLLAMARLSSFKPLALAAAGYVNLMRSLPLLLVIFWFYFLVPELVQSVMGWERPPQIGAERSAYVTFIMFQAAYYCEIMRAGIQSISRGQVGAAYAVGLTYWQAMKLIILPQAFRNMLPVLLTQTIILFQDTSLVYAIGAKDLLKAAEIAGKNYNRPVEMYLFVALIYFAICLALSTVVKRLQVRYAIVR